MTHMKNTEVFIALLVIKGENLRFWGNDFVNYGVCMYECLCFHQICLEKLLHQESL